MLRKVHYHGCRTDKNEHHAARGYRFINRTFIVISFEISSSGILFFAKIIDFSRDIFKNHFVVELDILSLAN